MIGLTIAMLLAPMPQDAGLPPVTPGTCRIAADRFAQFAPRVRQGIEASEGSDADRKERIAAFEADLAKNDAVLAAYRDVRPVEADSKPLIGLRGSLLVRYITKCADGLRVATLPPVAPGLCKMLALRDLQLLEAVRQSFASDAEAARQGRPHKYDDVVRGKALVILDADVARSQSVLERHAVAKPTDAEKNQALAMPREDQRLYLEACTA